MNVPPVRSWQRLVIGVEASDVDAVVDVCFEFGTTGVEEISPQGDSAVVAYFENFCGGIGVQSLQDSLLETLLARGIEPGPITAEIIPERNWNYAWRQFYKPVWVTPDIVIHPPWIEVHSKSGQISIAIEPAMAFGTGGHESTQLSVQALADSDVANRRCLDVGTGTGILAILAAKLGAQSVVAIDVDIEAVKCARHNVSANSTVQDDFRGRIDVKHGSVEIANGRKFDLIVANLESRYQYEILPKIPELMAPKAKILFSGLMVTEKKLFDSWLKEIDLGIEKSWEKNDWYGCAVFS